MAGGLNTARGSRRRAASLRDFVDGAVAGWNAFLATDAARALDRWAADALHVAGNLPYDRAMDAIYNGVSRLGGAWHRLFDGGHSLSGAWEAVRGALPDDSVLDEFGGYLLGLWNDLVTPNGLPLFTVSQDMLQGINSILEPVGLSTTMIKDMLTVTASEMVGGLAGVVVLLAHVKRRDPQGYLELAGYLGLTGLAAANPAVLAVALASAILGGRAEQAHSRPVANIMRGALIGFAAVVGASAGGALGGPVGAIGGGVLGALVMRRWAPEMVERVYSIRLRARQTRELIRLAAVLAWDHARPALVSRAGSGTV